MEPQFEDRILTCSDCHGDFVFTAGEQLFFFDKQFKNDPKRCKPCKSRRSGLSAAASGLGPAAAGLSRTETRTECSDCGIHTTVPFKPTQGRPVLCRQCFQAKARAASARPALEPVLVEAATSSAGGELTVFALTEASTNSAGETLSLDAAVVAAASMASASPQSSVATAADLASISSGVMLPAKSTLERTVPAAVMAAAAGVDALPELRPGLAADTPDA